MTRIYVAAAAACFAGAVLVAPAAEACISCEYTPEVVNTPVPAKAKKRAATRKVQAKPARKQAVKRTPPAKVPKTVTATPPVQTEAPVETATPVATEAATTEASSRSGTATAAFAEREAARAAAATEEPPAEVGCKRYSAEARTTVTVPCE